MVSGRPDCHEIVRPVQDFWVLAADLAAIEGVILRMAVGDCHWIFPRLKGD